MAEKGKGMGWGILLLLGILAFWAWSKWKPAAARIVTTEKEEEYLVMTTKEGGMEKVKATEVQSVLAAAGYTVSGKAATSAEAASLYMALKEGKSAGQSEAEYQAELSYSAARVKYMETLYAAQDAEYAAAGLPSRAEQEQTGVTYPVPVTQAEFAEKHPEVAAAKAKYTIAMYEWEITQKKALQERGLYVPPAGKPGSIEKLEEAIAKLRGEVTVEIPVEVAVEEIPAAAVKVEIPEAAALETSVNQAITSALKGEASLTTAVSNAYNAAFSSAMKTGASSSAAKTAATAAAVKTSYGTLYAAYGKAYMQYISGQKG